MSGMNGSGGAEIRVNPQEAARAALVFLARADFKRHERQAFDAAEALLNAIADNTVILTTRETQSSGDALTPADSPPPAH